MNFIARISHDIPKYQARKFEHLRTNKRCYRHIQAGRGHDDIMGLPKFYSLRTGPLLTEFIDYCLNNTPEEQTQAYEELAIVRHAASQMVALYSAAIETGNQKAIDAAAPAVMQVMQEVIRTCGEVSRIQAAGKDKFSIVHIKTIVNQIVVMMHSTFEGKVPRELMEEFVSKVESQIRLPAVENTLGTDVTPAVLAMDDTIPCH